MPNNTVKREYIKISRELGYPPKCEDEIVAAKSEHEISRIMAKYRVAAASRYDGGKKCYPFFY